MFWLYPMVLAIQNKIRNFGRGEIPGPPLYETQPILSSVSSLSCHFCYDL